MTNTIDFFVDIAPVSQGDEPDARPRTKDGVIDSQGCAPCHLPTQPMSMKGHDATTEPIQTKTLFVFLLPVFLPVSKPCFPLNGLLYHNGECAYYLRLVNDIVLSLEPA